MSTNDPINPDHYRTGKVECIDALEAATAGKTGIEAVCTANVIKYLYRYEAKNGLQDVLKAKWYLDKLIDVLTQQRTSNEVAVLSAGNDGWIEWRGGECPVDPDTRVEANLRDGYRSILDANHFRWQHRGNYGDIIAYRVVIK